LIERKFETAIQQIRNEIIGMVAKLAFEDELEKKKKSIPFWIIPGTKPRFRCCVHKERAIVRDRAFLAEGEDLPYGNAGLIQVIEPACEECPVYRFRVTEACRGCITHRCYENCPKKAIHIADRKAVIDYENCIECGICKKSCPYDAISDTQRPCIKACPADAISYGDNHIAKIDQSKCINCGACVYQCPFGAISDLSMITQAIALLKNPDIQVYAIIAPSIASQCTESTLGQVISAIKKLGFHDIYEAAYGADLILEEEAKEAIKAMEQNTFLTSSCCPSFVELIEKHYPSLSDKISTLVSPMIATARLIKTMDPKAKTIFIGPCISKKAEAMKENLQNDIDVVVTFEELLALFYARDIEPSELPESEINQASSFGRAFAYSGGVSAALSNQLSQINSSVDPEVTICNGSVECNKTLKALEQGTLKTNFVEGMVCQKGCIGGPSSFNRTGKAKTFVDTYSKSSKRIKNEKMDKTVKEINLHTHHQE
jgi:[FeFe] hydrogenase (group B1/B3)